MSITRSEMISFLKAKSWEVAKGELRAMVAIEGMCSADAPEDAIHRARWRAALDAVETFIQKFEADGLHE